MNIKIEAMPFDWNDTLSELAVDDFNALREIFDYCSLRSIGMALEKLRLLEEQGARVVDE